MLLDSNIIIYAAQPERAALRQFITEHAPVVSVISYVEVLGYHRLTAAERTLLEQFFKATEILPLSDNVIQQAIQLRQQRRMSLGDSSGARSHPGDAQYRRLPLDPRPTAG